MTPEEVFPPPSSPSPEPPLTRSRPLAGFFTAFGISDYERYLPHFTGAVFVIALLAPAVKLFALMGLVLAVPVMFLSSGLALEGGGERPGDLGKYYLCFGGSIVAVILSGFGLFS